MRSIALPSWIERAAGLEPRPATPHAFGVSRRELVYAGFAVADGRRTLLEAQNVPLPEGLFGAGALGAPVGDVATFEAAARTLVSRLAKAPKEAAVVVPDSWARGLMIDSTDLPPEPAARREILRFRLKRLVPFRVEELRVAASPLRLADVGGARAFATFANESLCALIEQGFARVGVRVGWISGATSALEAGVSAVLAREAPAAPADAPLHGLAVVDSEGFTLVLVRSGEPVVWRQKMFTDGLADADRERLLTAELKLTRSFLDEHQSGRPISSIFLAAPRAVEPFWMRVLEEGLGVAAQRLRAEQVGLEAEGLVTSAESASGLLALAGAVAREI